LKTLKWTQFSEDSCRGSTTTIVVKNHTADIRHCPLAESRLLQLSLKRLDGGIDGRGNEIRIHDGPKDGNGGTLDGAPQSFCYESNTQRLWLADYEQGLHFVDLIHDGTPKAASSVPSSPLLPDKKASHEMVACKSPSKYTVFISYSGTDKYLADCLYDMLTEMGISVFAAKREINVGENAAAVMIEAMENADIAVIIVSSEYPAKEWTMKELLCFQRRARMAKETGKIGPFTIPLFFRLDPSGCMSPNIMYMRAEDGENVFCKHRFFDEDRLAAVSVNLMVEAMRDLGNIQGVENPMGISYKPQPGQSEEEWRQNLHALLKTLVAEVVRVASQYL